VEPDPALLGVLLARLRHRFTTVTSRARSALQAAWHPKGVGAGLVADLSRTRNELLVENAMLRQQLIVAARAVKRAEFKPHERGLLVLLSSLFPRWSDALMVIKPETILRWHREGFRLFWKLRSVGWSCPQRIDNETVTLIRRMALENRTWGAERIRGELLKLGIRVAKRTIQRHLRAVRPRGNGQRWRAFLRNHTTWACDFVQVYDIWFRPLFVFFMVDVNTRHVVHVAVTRNPTESWTAQQMRNATFGSGPQVLVRDRDSKFGPDFDRAAKGAGVRVVKTAFRATNMNAICERFLGSVRRECLDRVIILGDTHLRSVLREYVTYFNSSRPHQGLGQHVPIPDKTDGPRKSGAVVVLPVLSGLHHDYRRAA
jgi:transposase InsO family protein